MKGTLTSLYNDRPTWLDNAHCKLDQAVFAAYRWTEGPRSLGDEAIIEQILKLNSERESA